MKDKKWPAMPYPGLRPFEVSADRDESDIFFGRKQQIYELIDRLALSHLIAVLGPSGCGKSSLIRAGVIPNLKRGYLDRAGARWAPVVMEPGGNPIRALAAELAKVMVESTEGGPLPDGYTNEALEARLNRRPDALVSFFEDEATETIFGADRNILILVDQFEELFRHDMTAEPDAQHFINLILNVFHDPPPRLYIILTMRTDFIKQSACYPGLPTVLSHTMYLIDKIDKMGLREAITAPVQLNPYRGKVDERLVRWILDQMTTGGPYDPDLLPLMQHALLRGWQKVIDQNQPEGEYKAVLRKECYAECADLADCLSKHADAVFDDLTAKQQGIAEVMFRLMCDVTPDGTKIRRVTNLKEIADVGGCSEEEALKVINAFLSNGTGFIRWKGEGNLLDVSHESFIRKWGKFSLWADQEALKAEKFKELLHNAQSREEKGLLNRMALDHYTKWENENKPTAAWAKRYLPKAVDENQPEIPFADVDAFLKESEEAWQREEIKGRNKKLAISMLSFCIIFAFLFALFSWSFARPHMNYTMAIDYLNKDNLEAAIGKLDEALGHLHHFPFSLLPGELKRRIGLDNHIAVIQQTKAQAYISLARLKPARDVDYEEKILESYDVIISKQPKNNKAHELLVDLIEIYLESNTADGAVAARRIYHIIEGKNVDSPDIYARIAQNYENKGDFQMARTAYTKGLEKDIDNTSLRIALGNVEINLATHMPGDDMKKAALLNEAKANFIRVNELKPDLTSVMEGLSNIYLQQNNRTDAIKYLELLVNRDPNNREACKRLMVEYFNQCSEFVANQNTTDALALLDKINGSSCLSDLELTNLGKFYIALSEMDRAILAFTTSIEKQQQAGRIDPEPYLLLANTFAKQKDYANAMHYYGEVLKINAKDYLALRGRAYCLKMQGKDNEADKLSKEAKKSEPWAPLTAAALR